MTPNLSAREKRLNSRHRFRAPVPLAFLRLHLRLSHALRDMGIEAGGAENLAGRRNYHCHLPSLERIGEGFSALLEGLVDEAKKKILVARWDGRLGMDHEF